MDLESESLQGSLHGVWTLPAAGLQGRGSYVEFLRCRVQDGDLDKRDLMRENPSEKNL